MRPTYCNLPGFDNRGGKNKMAVVSLIDRSTGRARSMVIENVTTKTVGKIVADNLAQEARLITDQALVYVKVGATLAGHRWVNHSYSCGKPK